MEKLDKQTVSNVLEVVQKINPEADRDQIEKVLIESYETDKSLKAIFGLNDEFIEAYYGNAYRYFQSGKYQEALSIFKLLQLLDTFDERFTLGIAKCYEEMKQYDRAFLQYNVLSMIDEDNPYPYWAMAECMKKKSGMEEATPWYMMCFYKSQGNDAYAEICQKAELAMAKGLKEKVLSEIEKNNKKK